MVPRSARLLSWLGVLLFPLCAAASPTATASPTVSFGERVVDFEGLTPAGRAVVFSIGKPPGHLMPVTARLEQLVEADAAGMARLEFPAPVAERSVWAVVDIASGGMALAAPEGLDLRRIDFPGRGIGATRRFLRDERRFLEVLVVRPVTGEPAGSKPPTEPGAWGGSFGDGGDDDADGALDGAIEAPVERLRAIGASPSPPGELLPGDVVIAVDPVTLEIYAATLAF